MKVDKFLKNYGGSVNKELSDPLKKVDLKNVEMENVLLVEHAASGNKGRFRLNMYVPKTEIDASLFESQVNPEDFKALEGELCNFSAGCIKSILSGEYLLNWEVEDEKDKASYPAQVNNNIGCAHIWQSDSPTITDFKDAYLQFDIAKEKALKERETENKKDPKPAEVLRKIDKAINIINKNLALAWRGQMALVIPIDLPLEHLDRVRADKDLTLVTHSELLNQKDVGISDFDVASLRGRNLGTPKV